MYTQRIDITRFLFNFPLKHNLRSTMLISRRMCHNSITTSFSSIRHSLSLLLNICNPNVFCLFPSFLLLLLRLIFFHSSFSRKQPFTENQRESNIWVTLKSLIPFSSILFLLLVRIPIGEQSAFQVKKDQTRPINPPSKKVCQFFNFTTEICLKLDALIPKNVLISIFLIRKNFFGYLGKAINFFIEIFFLFFQAFVI